MKAAWFVVGLILAGLALIGPQLVALIQTMHHLSPALAQ